MSLPSREDIARGLAPIVEGSSLHLGPGLCPFVWEANLPVGKPEELHLDVGYGVADTWDVVLHVRSIRPRGETTEGVWRVGHCQPQNLYEGDRFTGSMLTGRTAQRIAHAFTGAFFVAGAWTHDGRHLFEDGIEVGSEFTEADAARVVAVMNGSAPP